jgi:hypothetical protein
MSNRPPKDDFDREAVKSGIVDLLDRRRRRRVGDAPRKISAIRLAQTFGVRKIGSPDSRKRGVRALVDELRTEGVPIASDLAGYWIAENPADHAAYRDFLHKQGLARLAAESADKHSPAAQDATGQLALF